MNLLDLMVKIGVDDQASSKVDSLAGKITGALGTAAGVATKAVAAGVAAVTAATGAITKSSLDAYGAYEQNVGGIQKLFGNMGKSLDEYAELTGNAVDAVAEKWGVLEQSQNMVLQNAANAYKNAGMSANQYMEQVTGFSAALITSLGNDTVAAANYAEIAMVDMSDNANTFGTDMQSIQWAYQGFAKQNYTMLDNLKLGYGGTKEEMERLIADANKVKAANGEMAELSIDSFADVVEAIHIMQGEMQISGTTAREAATTIEGSVNMMKAAWENWLTGLGDSDADMSQLTDQLVDSFETAASNVIPRVGVIVGTLIGEIPGLVAQVGPALVDGMGQIGEQASNALRDSLSGNDAALGVFDGIMNAVDLVSQRVNGFKSLFSMGDNPIESFALAGQYALNLLDKDLGNLASAAEEAIPKMAEAAAGMVESLGQGIADNMPTVMQKGLEMLEGLTGSLREGAATLVDSGMELIENLAQGLADSMPTLIEHVPEIVSNIAGIINDNAPKLLETGFNVIVTLVGGLINAIPTIVENIPQIISAIVDAFMAFGWASLGKGAIDGLVNGVNGMVGAAGEAGASVSNGVVNAIRSLPGNLANLAKSAMYNFSSTISGMISAARSAALQVASGVESAILTLPSKMASIGSNIISGLVNGITSNAARVASAITGAVGGAIEAAKNMLGIHSPSRVFRDMFGYVMEGAALGIDDNADLPVRSMKSATDAVADAARFSASVDGGSAYGGTTPEGAAAIIAWLAENLPEIISEFTPVMGESEFGRKARKAVAYA